MVIADSAVSQLRNWLLVFAACEVVKIYALLQLRRAVRESEVYFVEVPLRVRLFGFAVDNVCFVWFLYGNTLYYNSQSQYDAGFVFNSLFCAILIYGYSCMVKFAFEFVVVFCVVPVWSFIWYLYPRKEPPTKLLKVSCPNSLERNRYAS